MNNLMFEWGRNCATLKYDRPTSQKIMDSYGEFAAEDKDQFWLGYEEEPRADGFLVPIPSDLHGRIREEKKLL